MTSMSIRYPFDSTASQLNRRAPPWGKEGPFISPMYDRVARQGKVRFVVIRNMGTGFWKGSRLVDCEDRLDMHAGWTLARH